MQIVKSIPSPPAGAGDTWTWTAIDADSKLIVSWLVGKRDARHARILIDDLKNRLANRVQITTDGLRAYADAVDGSFGADVDFAMLVKLYGEPSTDSPERKYSPSECIGTKVHVITGDPDGDHISTSYVERQNLTMRMHMRRFPRLTNGFSKKFANHVWMVAFYTVFYNFVKIHKSLRVTPAMQAGLTDRVWTFEELAGIIDAAAPEKKPRGPYKEEKFKLRHYQGASGVEFGLQAFHLRWRKRHVLRCRKIECRVKDNSIHCARSFPFDKTVRFARRYRQQINWKTSSLRNE